MTAVKELRKATHGWFVTDGRPGDRTLEQQIIGLDPLFSHVAGKTVLDVGCAEGLIAMECVRRGAAYATGVEIVPKHVEVGQRLAEKLPCELVIGDANVWEPDSLYDVVLLLAILHKLRDPSSACVNLARVAIELCVIRYPASSDGQVIVDERSNRQPHDIGDVMETLGFRIDEVIAGPFDEQTYYYRR